MLNDPPVFSRSFRGDNGDAEHFISITAPGDLLFHDQVDYIQKCYKDIQHKLKLSPESAIFRRLFVSDVINQSSFIHQSELVTDPLHSPVAISIVEQSPLPAAKIALLAYHIESISPLEKQRLSAQHVVITKKGTRHLWSTHLCAGAPITAPAVAGQTKAVFNDLVDVLTRYGSNLADHCVRTWLYIKNVDVFYRDMVTSRRELFAQQNLTDTTHYIASTGIAGCCEHPFDLVLMDAYSILDLHPTQISYLNDFARLCPTKDYGVTFERGTRIAYADRLHYFISGTASIDRLGKTVHLGDVMRQLDLALENIDALLRSGGSHLKDMMYFIVYLRDAADFSRVDKELRRRFPSLPIIIVVGAVCRPEWLIELEGVAITSHEARDLPSF